MICLRLSALILIVATSGPSWAQGHASIPVAVRFSATEANAPPGSCGCFWLRGAAADAAIPLLPRLSAVAEIAGATVARVPATTRGLSEITLLAGPRYAYPVRRFSVAAQALFGAVRGFDADFATGARHADTSTNFGMALGGLIEVPVHRRLTVRAVQIDYLQTNLPNGTDNRQRSLRVGAGVVFHVPFQKAAEQKKERAPFGAPLSFL